MSSENTATAAKFDPSSRSKLNRRALPRYEGNTLFDKLARAVCMAECLPRKELYEAWELARRTRRRFKGGRVVDMACGHALLAHVMLLLDERDGTAIAVDTRIPKSAAKIARVMAEAWPHLEGRVSFVEQPLAAVELLPGDVVVSCHACGPLTDEILARAILARARVAVVPCCHDERKCDAGGLTGWVDAPLAIDMTRAARLRAAGYAVHTQHIPAKITPKNRLLMGDPC